MFCSLEPEILRGFIRDELGFPYTDIGEGWLIFDLPEAEMECHPADDQEGKSSGTHDISFYCDNIEKTVAELKWRGVEFTEEVRDVGRGLATHLTCRESFRCSSTDRSTARDRRRRHCRHPRPADAAGRLGAERSADL